MKATALLEQQHRRIGRLLWSLPGLHTAQELRVLRAQLASELCAHLAIEQRIFYPRIRGRVGTNAHIDRLLEDDRASLRALHQLLAATPGTREFASAVVLLGRYQHRHQQELELGLFPAVEGIMVPGDLWSLCRRMVRMHEDLQAEGYARTLHALEGTPLERETSRP